MSRSLLPGHAGAFLLVATLVAVLLPASYAAAGHTEETVRVTADAHVSAAFPHRNYGDATNLAVGGSPVTRTYLRFDVATGDPVTRATLHLYVTEAKQGFDIHRSTSSDWAESTLTYANAPGFGDASATLRKATSGQWTTFDVTDMVGTGGAVSMVVTSKSPKLQSLASRETGSRAARLVIERAAAPARSVAVSSPEDGAVFTTAQTVPVTATVSPIDGVTKVEFYGNGELLGTEDTVPFTYSWSIGGDDNGSHRLTAKAFDDTGSSVVSTPVDVTVDVSAPPPTADPPGALPTATVETEPVRNSGDAADDPAIWVHPEDPARSTVIGTDKEGGLAVYDLSGRELHYYADSRPNNVDLRYDFPLGGRSVDLVVTSDRSTRTLRPYVVDPATRGLRYVAARGLSLGIGAAGLCMYRSADSGMYYAFNSDNSGTVQQWELFDNGDGLVDARKVRTLRLDSTTEGCVADDELGDLYVAEEDYALWKYGAEPDAGSTRRLVDSTVTAGGGNLVMDIEGLALYQGRDGTGYLIASSQGSSDFVLYDRRDPNAYVGRFAIGAGVVDAVTYTDGIEVTSVPLGSGFPEGLFVAQDDRNDDGNQNFKLVPWGSIARYFSPNLLVDTAWSPRAGGAPSPDVDTAPPRVSIVSPEDGSVYTDARVVKVTADAEDDVGVAKVEFHDQGGLRGVATAEPFAFEWGLTSADNGDHRWTARAFDEAGNVSESQPVDVRVQIEDAAGTTYYVDDVAGDDRNSGTSSSTAWKTLAKASAAPLTPGDRLLFRSGGIWTGRLTVGADGTRAAPISLGAYGQGARPIIQGSSTCVRLNGAHLVLSGLDVRGCSWAGIAVSGSANRIEGNVVSDTAAGIYVRSEAAGTRILRNTLRDNNRMSVLTPTPSNDDSGAFGILLHGDKTEVAHNTISGSDAFSYDYGRDGAAIEIYGARDSFIHHNVAFDNDAFSELGNPRSADNLFAYNLVTSPLEESVFVVTRGADSKYGPVLGTTLYNNTVRFTGSRSQGFVCHAGCSTEILRMRNNVIEAGWKAGYADAPFDEDHNLYGGGRRQFLPGLNSIVADPRFVDPAAGDLRLRPTSPAIDCGIDVGLTHDLDGEPVPLDGTGNGVAVPDCGAYEYRP